MPKKKAARVNEMDLRSFSDWEKSMAWIIRMKPMVHRSSGMTPTASVMTAQMKIPLLEGSLSYSMARIPEANRTVCS